MPRNIGTGISELGQTMQGFGLDLLKQGLDENKRLRAKDMFEQYRSFLQKQIDSGEVTVTEAQDAAMEGKLDILAQIKGEAPAAPAAEQAAGPQTATDILRGGPAAPAAPAGGETLLTEADKKPTGLQDVYAPFAEELAQLNKRIGSAEGKAFRDAIIKAGMDPSQLIKLEENLRGGVVSRGKVAIESAIAERKFGLKERELDIKEKDIERKRIVGEERNKLLEQRNDYQKYIGDKRVSLGENTLEWKKKVKDETNRITTRNNAARKVKELRFLVKEGRKSLRFGEDFVKIVKVARKEGTINAIKDFVSPNTEVQFTGEGLKLKERIKFFEKTIETLVKKWGIGKDVDTSISRRKKGTAENIEGFIVEEE